MRADRVYQWGAGPVNTSRDTGLQFRNAAFALPADGVCVCVYNRWATAEDNPLETQATTRMEADSTASSHPSKELLTLAGQLRTFSALLRGALPARAVASADYHAHVKLTLTLLGPPSATDASGTSSPACCNGSLTSPCLLVVMARLWMWPTPVPARVTPP